MKKILVVDNQPLILKFMSGFLEKRGYQVLTAEDGLSALDLLKIYTPDVIFIDLIMPNISGDKLCRIIRNMPHLNATRLIIFSAVASEDEIDWAEFGADACIAKGPQNILAEHILAALETSSVNAERDPSPKALGVEAINQRDVTKELLDAKKHSDSILNNMSEGILELTADAKIIYANPSAVSFIGIPEETILSAKFTDFFHENQRQRIKDLLQNPAKSRTIGRQTPLSLNEKLFTIQALPVKSDHLQNRIVIMNDISEQKKTEEALRRSEEKYRSLVEQLSEIIFVVNIDGVITYVNPAVESVTGYPVSEIIGCKGCKFILKEDLPIVVEIYEKIRSGSSSEIEFRIVTPSGKIRWLQTLCSPILVEGQVVSMEGVASDITEKKELQERLIRSHRLAATGQLASSIAHEINSPLQGITALLRLIKKEHDENEETMKNVQLLENAYQCIRDTVKKLLCLNRRSKENKQSVNINEVINCTLKLCESHLNKKNIAVRLNLSPSVPIITASPQQLSQVIISLIQNAEEAMEGSLISRDRHQADTIRQKSGSRKKEIVMETFLKNNHVTIEFADSGPGISNEDLKHIFDPFYTRKKTMGMGVGLSVCYRIIEEHKGTMTAVNLLEKGTVFMIQLPVKQAISNILPSLQK